MSLSRRDIDNIAQLARLALSESEVPAYIDSLSRIIALVGELDHADTRAVAPMSHPLAGLVQRQRPHVGSEGDRPQLFPRDTPQGMGGPDLRPQEPLEAL